MYGVERCRWVDQVDKYEHGVAEGIADEDDGAGGDDGVAVAIAEDGNEMFEEKQW